MPTYENELKGTGGQPDKAMDKVPAYDRVTFPYTDLSGTTQKKVTQDSLPSHRNSHDR